MWCVLRTRGGDSGGIVYNKFEILRLVLPTRHKPVLGQLGFYLLALCSHIVFRASKPQFEPQTLKFVAREAARRDKGASMTGPEPPRAAGRGKKAQGRDDARSRSEVRRRKTATTQGTATH